MKSIIWWIMLFNSTNVLVEAFGERGAAERIALYFAYLAQNILNGDNEDLDKIAAGCPGERGRCTFNEFVEFLWKPDKDGTFQRPTANFVGDQDDFVREATRNYNPLFQEINRYADVETGGHFTGSTDTQKIWLGATDWYDAMGKVGGPLGELQERIPGLDPNQFDIARCQAIVDGGKKAFEAAYDLRLKDMEKPRGSPGRIRGIAQRLGLEDSDLFTRPGRRTYSAVQAYQTIDAAATIARWAPQRAGDFAADFNNARRAWETGGKSAKAHFAAAQALDSAQRLTRC